MLIDPYLWVFADLLLGFFLLIYSSLLVLKLYVFIELILRDLLVFEIHLSGSCFSFLILQFWGTD